MKDYMNPSGKNPFLFIRGRWILPVFFFVPSFIAIFIYMLWPAGSSADLWPEIISSILGYCLTAYFINWIAERAELDKWLVVGRMPGKEEILGYLLLVIPMFLLSFGCLFLFYLPLSYLTPALVNSLLIEDPVILIWSKGPFLVLANLMNFLLIVAIAPIIEEIVFRGLLISRWSVKWGTPRAILFSSIIFGIGHLDFIGGFFFGVVMAVLYIKSNSLIIPILVHVANNFIFWIFALVETIFSKSTDEYSLADFQSEWWMGALGLIIGVPWVFRYMKSNWNELYRHVPYFA